MCIIWFERAYLFSLDLLCEMISHKGLIIGFKLYDITKCGTDMADHNYFPQKENPI